MHRAHLIDTDFIWEHLIISWYKIIWLIKAFDHNIKIHILKNICLLSSNLKGTQIIILQQWYSFSILRYLDTHQSRFDVWSINRGANIVNYSLDTYLWWPIPTAPLVYRRNSSPFGIIRNIIFSWFIYYIFRSQKKHHRILFSRVISTLYFYLNIVLVIN